MTHPITSLQGALVAALNADAALAALIGGSAVFDGPPKGAVPPYVVVARHDVASRDGDLAPGHEHRMVLQVWHPEANRRALMEIVERVTAVALSAELSGPELVVTLAAHVRTETQIDGKTGRARAAVTLKFLSEPTKAASPSPVSAFGRSTLSHEGRGGSTVPIQAPSTLLPSWEKVPEGRMRGLRDDQPRGLRQWRPRVAGTCF